LANHTKPKLIGPERAVCPVCGTTAYSLGGIHPQCASILADRVTPRVKVKTPKPAVRQQWTKRCPKCKRDLHVRRVMCDCGHSFQAQPRSEQSN